MADIVDLQGRMQARQAEEQRLDLTAKMLPIMAATIERFVAMGASHDHIVRLLQATVEEMKGSRL